MRKQLPEAVRELDAVAKLVWVYIQAHPGQHSVRTLATALGGHPDRAIPKLLAAGLLIEEEAPAGSRLGRYHVVEARARAEETA